MSLETVITQKLTGALNPSHLKVKNQSHLHAGHAGSPGTGESHFKVEVTSDEFEGLTRIQRHQKIYAILKDEMKTKIHALTISAKTPAEN